MVEINHLSLNRMSRKGIFKSVPYINALIKFVNRKFKNIKFSDSRTYWEERYKIGGNSGGGSYNHLADFKARILNRFIHDHNIKTVIEFGCGDGNQLSLAEYPCYIGLDISETAIAKCIKKYNDDSKKSFFLYNSLLFADNYKLFQADLALSLDVIYHLVEDKIFNKYMFDLFQASKRFVIIYSSNFEGKQYTYCRSRKFTHFIEKYITNWKLKKIIKNEYPFDHKNPDFINTSWSDFYIFEKVLV